MINGLIHKMLILCEIRKKFKTVLNFFLLFSRFKKNTYEKDKEKNNHIYLTTKIKSQYELFMYTFLQEIIKGRHIELRGAKWCGPATIKKIEQHLDERP